MTRYVIETDQQLLLVRGHHAGQLLRSAGLQPRWSNAGGGWVLDLDRLPDVRAVIEHAHGGYRETPRGTP